MEIRNTYAKYKHPVTYNKKVMDNFLKKVKGNGQGHTLKIYVRPKKKYVCLRSADRP